MSTPRLSAPSRIRGRFESLDDWRGLACLFVIVYHSTIVFSSLRAPAASPALADALVAVTHSLNVGVALFFVISGYCIAAAADNARSRGFTTGQYFGRRFRRIYPPFWFAVAASVACFFVLDYGWSSPLLSSSPWMQYRPWWYSPSQWIGNLTLTETWRHYLFGSPRGHFPGQAWTLCYEEQFYFVMGMLLLVSRKRFFAGVALVSALTAGVALLCRSAGVPIEGFFFDGSWLLFAAGVAAYYRLHHASSGTATALTWLLIGAVPVSWFFPVPIYGATVGFCFAAALPALYEAERRFGSYRFPPLVTCGRMCYSLYLVHQIPVKAVSMALYRAGVTSAAATLAVTVPSAVAVSLGLGWTFYQLVERRFLNAPVTAAPAPALQPTAALASAPQ